MAIVPIEDGKPWGEIRQTINSNIEELDTTSLKADGSVPLTGDLDVGGNVVENVADAPDDNAVPRYGQAKAYADNKAQDVLDRLDLFKDGGASGEPLPKVVDCNEITTFVCLRTQAGSANVPPGTEYWYLFVIPYAGNCMQLAVSYTSPSLLAYRHFYNSAWTEWKVVPSMRFDSGTGTLYIRDDGAAP